MIEQSTVLPIDRQRSLADRVIAFVRTQGHPAWLVGGFVRDQLLGRDSHDLDLIVPEGGIRLARAVAAAFGGASFVLDDARDVGRAIVSDPAGESLDVDVARLRVPDLLEDLALRDFTINAIAMDAIAMDAIAMDANSTAAAPILFDPFDGQTDVSRRLLRAVTEGAFRDDPLRMLRGVRMVAELGFEIEHATYNLMRRDAPLIQTVSGERVRDELMRILTAPGAWQRLRLLAALGLLRYTLPEAAAQGGVTQSAPHYQDVFDHTRSVLAHLEGIYALLWPEAGYARPQPVADDPTVVAAEAQWSEMADTLAPFTGDLRAHLSLPLASAHTRRDLLLWAAVTHDWGKPAKRTENGAGQTHFYDHDRWGALLVESRLQALKFAGDEVTYVARLTDLHMRPAHLARDFPPTPRAIYRYYRDAATTGPDCVLLGVADQMAMQAQYFVSEAWQRRLATSRVLFDAYFRDHARRISPAPLLNGRQVMAECGLGPGPRIGELLEGLREAQAIGEVNSEAEARTWLHDRVSEAA
jgi:tRNA nucleotidyltransferase/poly(A) polymerase